MQDDLGQASWDLLVDVYKLDRCVMGELVLGVDFKARSRTKPQPAQPHEAELAAMFASGLDTDPEVLAAFYESSLGYQTPPEPEPK